MPDVRTEVTIAASAERVWDVLTDFAAYPQWSPMIRTIAGQAQPGRWLRLGIAKTLGQDETLPLVARVRRCEPARRLAWGGGVPGAPWLLDVEHYFELTPSGDGRSTHLVHGENFQGLLIQPLWPLIARRVEPGYPATNEALRARCEAA